MSTFDSVFELIFVTPRHSFTVGAMAIGVAMTLWCLVRLCTSREFRAIFSEFHGYVIGALIGWFFGGSIGTLPMPFFFALMFGITGLILGLLAGKILRFFFSIIVGRAKRDTALNIRRIYFPEIPLTVVERRFVKIFMRVGLLAALFMGGVGGRRGGRGVSGGGGGGSFGGFGGGRSGGGGASVRW